ncbi:MAG TPA: CvpA family protein [Verrucomicrobiae bacterium]|nr:CvpA family protein [Verrucomicrobiae bacterium]
MELAILPPIASHAKFDYFDIVVLDWLILGLLRGRRTGMSRELLPLLQWIGIVLAAGLFYPPVSSIINQCTYLSPLWSNVSAYLLIAAAVHLIHLWLRRLFAVKLVEWNLFGAREYHLGMIAGMARFTCILLFVLALMTSEIPPSLKPAKLANSQKAKTGIRLPTYGELQQDVLSNSFSGNWVQSNLRPVLIAAVTPPQPKLVSQKTQKTQKPGAGILASQTKTAAQTKSSP